jgi:hypothetical protein
MANQKKPGGSKLNEDELIKNLVPDPSQVPDARMLFGFLGKSSREGYWRLYLTPELNRYVEFQEEDVLHTLSFATPENPLGGQAAWVKREANLLHTRTVSREAQAEFLEGDITAKFLASTAMERLLSSEVGVTYPPTEDWKCKWYSMVVIPCPLSPRAPRVV